MWLRKKRNKKTRLKSLIRFHSAKKIDNYNGGGEKGKKKKKKSKRIYKTSTNIRIINIFLESLLSVFSLTGVKVHLTSLGCPPTLLISGPAVGAAQILIWSYSCVFLPSVSTAIRTSVFSFVGTLNDLLYIP